MKAAVLVPDSQARASIAAIRSLGRAGYEVHACASDVSALGLKSNFASQVVLHPPFDDSTFPDWLRDYVDRNGIRMIVPTSGLLRAVLPRFGEFKALLPVSDDAEVIETCLSKTRVVERYLSADPGLGMLQHHPVSIVVDLDGETALNDLADSAYGYYIKAESRRDTAADAAEFAYEREREQVPAVLERMAAGWRRALVQTGCEGFQVGVSVLMSGGRALAISCVRDVHPRPHSKGTMSLRESGWFPEIAADTVRRLAYLGWEGCAMGEYRYDPASGEFTLIEINFRYWQYLHLDLWAGMDYPRFQAEWFLDGRVDFDSTARPGVRCRDPWPGEVAHLVNELRQPRGGLLRKLVSVAAFFGRFLNPSIHQDFAFPGDRKLYLLNFLEYLRSEIKGRFQ